jgi:hypothetical protein
VTEQQLARMAKRRLAILRHAEEITGNVALISLGVDSMQDDQSALKPRSCTGRQEVGP